MKRFKRFKTEKYNGMAEVSHNFKVEETDDGSKITIYGEIGDFWWDATSASDIEKVLRNVTSENIEVHINSPGGDAFDGIAIYNQLKDHPAKITVYIDGLAASAASIIAMAADELIMNTGSMLMIHEAWTFAFGSKGDIKKTLNALEGIDKSLADIYMTRFQGERSEVETMLVNETWFTSSEAVEVGLADRVNEVEEEVDPEEFKNNVLQRFRQIIKEPIVPEEPIVASKSNVLDRFKRLS